jgi:hypothetical protein
MSTKIELPCKCTFVLVVTSTGTHRGGISKVPTCKNDLAYHKCHISIATGMRVVGNDSHPLLSLED